MPDGTRQARLESLWYGPGTPPLALRVLAALHGSVLAARRAAWRHGLFRPGSAGVPVIVVGNLTVGGTGKTPLTAWLVERLRGVGRRPGIASRGYGRRARDVHLVEPDDDPAIAGDEPLMLRRQTGAPVCVAPRRLDAARRLVAAGCDIVVCDDGLQHLALARDLAFAVVDGSRGLGNGRLLPAGPLREPAARLSGVDAVVVNGELRRPLPATGGVPRLAMSLLPAPLQAVTGDATRPLDWLRGRRVQAITGIGNPERFFAQLRALGAEVSPHGYPDHHVFTPGQIRVGEGEPVILTAKDAVKCRAFADDRHWVLPVRAAFGPADERWLMQRIQALAGPGETAT